MRPSMLIQASVPCPITDHSTIGCSMIKNLDISLTFALFLPLQFLIWFNWGRRVGKGRQEKRKEGRNEKRKQGNQKWRRRQEGMREGRKGKGGRKEEKGRGKVSSLLLDYKLWKVRNHPLVHCWFFSPYSTLLNIESYIRTRNKPLETIEAGVEIIYGLM